MFITTARHEAALRIERMLYANEADKNYQLSQQLHAAEGRRLCDLEALGTTYKQQLQDVVERLGEDLAWVKEMAKESEIGLEGRHAAELQRMQATLDQQATASNALFGQLLAELRATREQSIELQRALLTLRREGFAEPLPAAARVEDVQLPAVVAAAIAEHAFSPDIAVHLERYAWEQLEAGMAPAEIVQRIKQGEDPAPVRSAAAAPSGRTSVVGGKVVGQLPPDSPAAVHSDDDEDDDG